MNNYPLVSVIISAYNHERFVQETIRSIIAQTYQNIELIIIDDGSSDRTYQKILELKPICEQRFKRVVMETQDNQGTCITFNKLIEKVQGQFIYIIASDDVAKPQAIETLTNFMISHNDYVVVVGDNEFIGENSECMGWDELGFNVRLSEARYKTFGTYLRHLRKEIDFLSGEFGSYKSLIQNNYIPNGALTRTTAQKKRALCTKKAPLEDWFMHLQLSKLGKYKYIDEVLLSYRQHLENTFRRRDMMVKYALKTLLYEQKLVHQKNMEQWAEIFDEYAVQRKTKFRVGKLLHYYKKIDLEYKTNILEIFGRKFTVKRKKR